MGGLRLGAHMSIAGGPANALLLGHSIRCDTIQMFVRPANRWESKDLTSQQIQDFEQAREATGIAPIIAHCSYLISLGTPDQTLRDRSLGALITELKRCQQLGIGDYVLHPGAHLGSGEGRGLDRIATGLSAALEAIQGAKVIILLETTAGQGTNLGYRFEQLAWLIEQVGPHGQLGVCFDTAHVLAAGYEFRQPDSYQAMWDHFGKVVGMEHLRAVHLNDSKRDLGSRIDRHEHIGMGAIGLEAFRMLVNDPRLRHLPMLLETPKGPELVEDIENLTLLRGLVSAEEQAQTS